MARTGLILFSPVCFPPTIQARPAITQGNSPYAPPDNNTNAYQNYIAYSTTARHFAWPLLLSNFVGSRKYISHVMVISEELISILHVSELQISIHLWSHKSY